MNITNINYNITTWTFKTNEDDWYIDIVIYRNGQTMFAWLWHEDYGVKELILGYKTDSIEKMIELTEAQLDEAVEQYKENYFEV